MNAGTGIIRNLNGRKSVCVAEELKRFLCSMMTKLHFVRAAA